MRDEDTYVLRATAVLTHPMTLAEAPAKYHHSMSIDSWRLSWIPRDKVLWINLCKKSGLSSIKLGLQIIQHFLGAHRPPIPHPRRELRLQMANLYINDRDKKMAMGTHLGKTMIELLKDRLPITDVQAATNSA